MGMKILHTSDWHLGHTLHDAPRDHEHDVFLAWLADTLEAQAIDALLITGDVFDSANPPASAQARWYGFLADIRTRMANLDVVVIGGNHDSAARLDAPAPLFEALRMHVVGGLPRRFAAGSRGTARRTIDVDRMIIPLRDGDGEVVAYVAAVPFLRPADLPRISPPHHLQGPERDPEGAQVANDQALAAEVDQAARRDDEPARPSSSDPLIEGVRQVYAEVLDAARERCGPDHALIATGHCYMVGTELSLLSERRILGGNQHALPVDIFPDDVAYVALGHLHKAQHVGGLEHVRYAGSPIPLAMGEARYRHQVCVVEFSGRSLTGVESLTIPRAVDIMRVPRIGAAPLTEVLAAIDAMPALEGNHHSNKEPRPYLEICVSLPRPEVNLRSIIETALDGKQPRLLKLAIEYAGTGLALGAAIPEINLRDLDPAQVFLQRYQRDHEDEPESELVAAFQDLLDQLAEERAR